MSKKIKAKAKNLTIITIVLATFIALVATTFGVGYYMNGDLDIANWWKKAPASGAPITQEPIEEAPEAPFTIGETCAAVYFDTKSTPDLSELDYNEDGLYTLVSGTSVSTDEPYQVIIQAVDLGVYLDNSGYEGIYLIVKGGATNGIYYSSALFESADIYTNVSEGWQNLNEDGSAMVLEGFVVEESVYVPYISGTTFVEENPAEELAPFTIGETCTDVYFDTKSTPDLSELNYSNGIYYIVFGTDNSDRFEGIMAVDLGYLYGDDLKGIYTISTNRGTILYSSSAVELSENIPQGWQNLNEDGSPVATLLNDFTIRTTANNVPFISSTPFVTEDPITEDPAVVNNPIAVGDEITTLYFNTSKSVAEVDALLAQLDWDNCDEDYGDEVGGELKLICAINEEFYFVKINGYVEANGDDILEDMTVEGYAIAASGCSMYASSWQVAKMFGGDFGGWSEDIISEWINHECSFPCTVESVASNQEIWGALISKEAFN